MGASDGDRLMLARLHRGVFRGTRLGDRVLKRRLEIRAAVVVMLGAASWWLEGRGLALEMSGGERRS